LNNSNRTIREERYKIPETEKETDKQDGFETESEKEDEREVETHPYKRRDEPVEEEILPTDSIETTLCRDETGINLRIDIRHKS